MLNSTLASPFRSAIAVLALLAVTACGGGGGGDGGGGASAPLARSDDDRHVVNGSGKPVLILGDAAQGLIVNLTVAQAQTYFAKRQEQEFNAAWVNVLVTTYTGGVSEATTYDGIAPFTQKLSGGKYDLRSPNEAYFERVDAMVAAAAEHGIHLWFDPIETGGFLDTLRANGASAAREYGRYLGERYRDRNNIVWMSGNDFRSWQDTPSDDELVYEVALGIWDEDKRHLQTTELDDPLSSSLDDPRWDGIIGINNTYTYYPTYAQLYVDWQRNPHLPNVFIEGNYEGEALGHTIRVTNAFDLRNELWWAVLSGATGAFGGNHWTNHFRSGWQTHLSDDYAKQVKYLRGLLGVKRWDLLVPDIDHDVAIAGYGTFSDCCTAQDNDFVTTARASDGSFVLSYFPFRHNLTIDMTELRSPATASWYDPTTGDSTRDSASPVADAGTHVFTPPAAAHADGSHDWVLVLDAG
jgi:hypothetical protein